MKTTECRLLLRRVVESIVLCACMSAFDIEETCRKHRTQTVVNNPRGRRHALVGQRYFWASLMKVKVTERIQPLQSRRSISTWLSHNNVPYSLVGRKRAPWSGGVDMLTPSLTWRRWQGSF